MAWTSSADLARVGLSLVLFNRVRPIRYVAVDLVIVGAPLVLASPGRVLTPTTGFALASVLDARLGGLILDDYADREADALAAPERPIPRGLVSPREALALGAGALLAGLATATLVGPTFLAVLTGAYALLFASVGVLDELDRPVVATAGTVTSVSMLSLLGWVAHGDLALPAAAAVLATWSWDWAHDALGDARDRAADERVGIATMGGALSSRGLAALAGAGVVVATVLVGWLVHWGQATVVVASFGLLVVVALAVTCQVLVAFARGDVAATDARRAVEWHLVVTYGLAAALALAAAAG